MLSFIFLTLAGRAEAGRWLLGLGWERMALRAGSLALPSFGGA